MRTLQFVFVCGVWWGMGCGLVVCSAFDAMAELLDDVSDALHALGCTVEQVGALRSTSRTFCILPCRPGPPCLYDHDIMSVGANALSLDGKMPSAAFCSCTRSRAPVNSRWC